MNPRNAIDIIAHIIPITPNIGFDENVDTICEIIPNAGIINIYTSGCLPNSLLGVDYIIIRYCHQFVNESHESNKNVPGSALSASYS